MCKTQLIFGTNLAFFVIVKFVHPLLLLLNLSVLALQIDLLVK